MALRWFRFGKKQEEDAVPEGAASEVEAPPEAPVQAVATEPTDEQGCAAGAEEETSSRQPRRQGKEEAGRDDR